MITNKYTCYVYKKNVVRALNNKTTLIVLRFLVKPLTGFIAYNGIFLEIGAEQTSYAFV